MITSRRARRPGYIERTLPSWGTRCGLAAALLYTWVTPERNPADSQDWYGIENPPTPSAGTPDTAAFAAGLRGATQPRSGAGRLRARGPTVVQLVASDALALAVLERQGTGAERGQRRLDEHLVAIGARAGRRS